MKRFVLLVSFVIAYFFYGLWVTQYEFHIQDNDIKAENPDGFYDYRGVTNVQFNAMENDDSLSDLVSAAQEANLNFLYLVNTNQFESIGDLQGYYQNLMVMVADKISYLDSRLLYYGIKDKKPFKSLGEAQVFFTDYLSQPNRGGDSLVVLAHPAISNYEWTENSPLGLDGLEVINLRRQWQEALQKNKISVFWSVWFYPFNPRLALARLFVDATSEVSLWDRLAQTHSTFGFVGNDVLARAVPLSHNSIRIPSYRWSFSIALNHVLLQSELTGNFEYDRKKIFSGLKKGNFYMSLDILENPKGFVTYIEDSQNHILPMGSELKFVKGLQLIVKLPKRPLIPYEIVVFRNGERYRTFNEPSARLTLHEAGVYRVFVRVIPTLPIPDGKKWIPWIYANPFFVRDVTKSGT